MIVEASAILAILLSEPEAKEFSDKIMAASKPRISIINYLEVSLRFDRTHDLESVQIFESFLKESEIVIETVSLRQGEIARHAYQRFGKGRHGAGLNLADVFAYALAIDRNEPLLFKGNDFTHTDVRRVV